MIAISIEQPPANLPLDVQEYLTRVLIQIAGAFQEAELEISQLENRIKVLEAKP